MTAALIAIDDARAAVLAAAPAPLSERFTFAEALDRYLLADVVASHDQPPFASSAMDGFAVAAGPPGRVLPLAGESRAGAPASEPLPDGAAIRISTGAMIPDGADAVVRLEDADERDGAVALRVGAEAGANIRGAAEDFAAGDVVLRAGTRLGPAELAIAAAAGAAGLECGRPPRVRIVCTGDELRPPGEPLGPGEIHNSNGAALAALARRAGAQTPEPLGAPDDPAGTREVLERALADSEVLIVSGGVSVGPHDHVRAALAELGAEEVFWGVALQPGKPTAFATRGDQLIFALPGNPVSAFVTFALFARPALERVQGGSGEPLRRRARLASAVARRPQRAQALRVDLADDERGLVATPAPHQGSHVVSSLLGADGLAIVPAGEGELAAGAPVDVELL